MKYLATRSGPLARRAADRLSRRVGKERERRVVYVCDPGGRGASLSTLPARRSAAGSLHATGAGTNDSSPAQLLHPSARSCGDNSSIREEGRAPPSHTSYKHGSEYFDQDESISFLNPQTCQKKHAKLLSAVLRPFCFTPANDLPFAFLDDIQAKPRLCKSNAPSELHVENVGKRAALKESHNYSIFTRNKY